MASFKDWALQYVLADEPAEAREIATKAAREIEKSRASSITVGNWASSIHQWMGGSGAGGGSLDSDGEDPGEGGNVISRAKALGFLSSTLETLDPAVLKRDQIQRLSAFFGSMFSVDHKAGITASALALRRLVSAKNFEPGVGVRIIEDICKIGDDFRLQATTTRLEVYELFLQLLLEPDVASRLRAMHGPPCRYVADLVRLCRNERDPINLMIWFKILRAILTEYSPSAEITEDVFKAFSAYFPISIRSSATAAGVTANELKGALRCCFSAHRCLAPLAFPFLVQKLDQGDAITVAVKLDILRSIQACVENYDDPQDSLLPHTTEIWGSLKYEVRNGEVKETVDATLDVLRSITNRLDGSSSKKLDVAFLKTYVDLVFIDCIDDLSNPSYTKQAGLLLITVATSNIRAFILGSQKIVDSISKNLRQPKSPSHTRDLLALYDSLLLGRSALVEGRHEAHSSDQEIFEDEPLDHLRGLFDEVYLPLWRENNIAPPTSDQEAILETAIRGMGLLCSQRAALPHGRSTLLNSPRVCSEACALFIHRLLGGLTLSANDNPIVGATVEDETVLALRRIVMGYRDGFVALMEGSKLAIKSRNWRSPSQQALEALKGLITRLTFISCSEVPWRDSTVITMDSRSAKIFSPLDYFATLTGLLVDVLGWLLDNDAAPIAVSLVLSGLHGSLRNFADACPEAKPPGVSLRRAGGGPSVCWLDEFKRAISSAHIPPDWVRLLDVHYGFSVNQEEQDADFAITRDEKVTLEGFTRLSLFIIRHLYLRFTEEALGSGLDDIATSATVSPAIYQQYEATPYPFLFQLAGMASFTIRRLDAESQREYNLAIEAFQLFRAPNSLPSDWMARSDGTLGVLTLGILESLWPDAMADVVRVSLCLLLIPPPLANRPVQYKPDGIAETLMTSIGSLPMRSGRASFVTGSIFTILANKCGGGLFGSDQCRQMFGHVLEFWKSELESFPTYLGEKNTYPEAWAVPALSILAGALARQDKEALGLIPLVHEAIGAVADQALARSTQILVQDKVFLTRESHAIIKPLYKQWAYVHLVKPLYRMALPISATLPRAENYTVTILSILKHCPYAVYADDTAPLVRLLLTSLLNVPSLHDKQASLQILQRVLRNEPGAVRDHLKTIIDASIKVYELTLIPSTSTAPDTNLAACRKLVLQLLGELPERFDERHLLHYSPRMQRMLARASGDPVREVRKAALVTRNVWARVT